MNIFSSLRRLLARSTSSPDMTKAKDWQCTRCLALKSEWSRIPHPGKHPSCMAEPSHACPMVPLF